MAVMALLVAGCASGSDVVTPERLDGTWVWVAATVDGEPFALDPSLSTEARPDVPGWLRFRPGGILEGEGPCNHVRGRYRLDGDRIVFDVTVTLVGCMPEQMMEAEAVLVDDLLFAPEVTATMRGDHELVLADEDTELVFRRIP